MEYIFELTKKINEPRCNDSKDVDASIKQFKNEWD